MRRSLLLLALVLLARPLAATMTFVDGAPAAVELVAPSAGHVLVAGSDAELAWEPGEGGTLQGAEEWEAFLSLDGGATYPLRITPHLDLDVRRVRWRVPSVPTRDTRLLLRFGDERRETVVELPLTWTIVPASGGEAAALAESLAAPPPMVASGEPARAGERGVVAWVEGTRRGLGWRQVAGAPWLTMGARLDDPAAASDAIAAVVPRGSPAALAAPDSGAGTSSVARGGRPLPATSPRSPSLPILLQSNRRNE